MTDDVDWDHLSIDGLIRRVAKYRVTQPEQSLLQWIGNRTLDKSRLVDIVCIDLMHRRRIGQMVSVEDYLRDFPNLTSTSDRLDIIDAEVCVMKELGHDVAPEQYLRRFPELAKSIDELFSLNESTYRSPIHIEPTPFDSTLSPPGEVTALPTPNWFAAGQCIAASGGVDERPGHWLFRGRDRSRSAVLALKVVELASVSDDSSTAPILDICEAAAAVNHPAWVRPWVATVHGRYLAVIRPWIFARGDDPKPSTTRSTSDDQDRLTRSKRLHELARVAYCLAAAHHGGSTHGAVHRDNVLIDQQGLVQLVDAGCGRSTPARWRYGSPSIASFADRRRDDVTAIQKLVAATMMAAMPKQSSELIQRVQKAALSDDEQPCAAIGDALIQWADQKM